MIPLVVLKFLVDNNSDRLVRLSDNRDLVRRYNKDTLIFFQ